MCFSLPSAYSFPCLLPSSSPGTPVASPSSCARLLFWGFLSSGPVKGSARLVSEHCSEGCLCALPGGSPVPRDCRRVTRTVAEMMRREPFGTCPYPSSSDSSGPRAVGWKPDVQMAGGWGTLAVTKCLEPKSQTWSSAAWGTRARGGAGVDAAAHSWACLRRESWEGRRMAAARAGERGGLELRDRVGTGRAVCGSAGRAEIEPIL